jgi:hypothetical protein
MPLPAADLRHNLATYAVPTVHLPAVAALLQELAPREEFDPNFYGQGLSTTYFDTPGFALRKARLKNEQYLTLRLRCYRAPDKPEAYALSAKTEGQKFRLVLDADTADNLLRPQYTAALLSRLLPAHLQARLLDLVADAGPPAPAVAVLCRRYAVEDDRERWTLDVEVHTDTGLCLPAAVLEFKSTDPNGQAPGAVAGLGLRPVKLSKFLWASDLARR